MKKLIQGIVEFRRTVQEGYREAFGRLAIGQSPDALFVACSDSRVVPNTFASTNPGDLFVLRNVGNLIPPFEQKNAQAIDDSEAAAIEFSVNNLNVADIIVCGHSECGAMQALLGDRNKIESTGIRNWLAHGDPALDRLRAGLVLDKHQSAHNQLSQINVLLQMENVKSYPCVERRMREGSLAIHGWWFDITKADVYNYSEQLKQFILIDEEEAERQLSFDHLS